MASQAKDKTESTEMSPVAPASSGSNKLVVLLAGVNIAVTIVMVAILFISFTRESKHASVEDIAVHAPAAEKAGEKAGGHEGEKAGEGAKPKAISYGKMVTLDQFTVNLATPGSATPRFVRVNISLEVPNEDSEAEVNLKMPQIRNIVIDLFNSKRPSDLATAEGRDYLKDEIRNAINTFMVSGKVKGVFFTNFALST